MKLENLIDFEWHNDPENVIFLDQGMKIVAKPQTDFWQSLHHQVKKDNAHFFYKKLKDNFTLMIKWRFETIKNFNQCGVMIKADERNWFKSAVMSKDDNSPEIGTCLTINGHSDWAGAMLSKAPCEVYYKLKRQGEDFICFYSLDGKTYIRLRQFYLKIIEPEIKVGAYIAAPQNESFEAVLTDVEIK